MFLVLSRAGGKSEWHRNPMCQVATSLVQVWPSHRTVMTLFECTEYTLLNPDLTFVAANAPGTPAEAVTG